MKIKLCRIFNLFNNIIIIYTAMLLLITLIFGFIYNNFWNVLIVPVFSTLYCFNYTKFLKIENSYITYKDFEIISNRGKGKTFKFISNEITVKASQVEFKQNIIEKIFNAGHINFINEEDSRKHIIYGITRFDDINKFQIEKQLKQV